jgi:hypothetical protein
MSRTKAWAWYWAAVLAWRVGLHKLHSRWMRRSAFWQGEGRGPWRRVK